MTMKMRMMKERALCLLLLSGFLCVCSREYVLVREYKTWAEAQDFCRVNNMDLASAETQDDWIQMNSSRDTYKLPMWIGLYDDVNSWRWSYGDEILSFSMWDRGQPDNYRGNQDCVIIHSNGFWHDKRCDLRCAVACQSGGEAVVLGGSLMSWSEARSLCRAMHEDLLTVRSVDQNQYVRLQGPAGVCVWIGLWRDGWSWADGSARLPSSTLPWAAGQPNHLLPDESCASAGPNGLIQDQSCTDTLFFICRERWRMHQLLRLEVKADAAVDDHVIAAAVLHQVQQAMGANVQLTWRRQTDGRLFQKIQHVTDEKP